MATYQWRNHKWIRIMSTPEAIPDEFLSGTPGDAATIRPDSPLEDILMAHRYELPLVSQTVLRQQSETYAGKPIKELPIDFQRLVMRHVALPPHVAARIHAEEGIRVLPRRNGNRWY